MAKLSISKAWDETRSIVARDRGLLFTVALALFVLPGVISDLVTPDAPASGFPPVGYWTAVTVVAPVPKATFLSGVFSVPTYTTATVFQNFN